MLNYDGAPIVSALLSKMTETLRTRGPDEVQTWVRANAGLGHALLRTSPEIETDYQPLSLDGHIWIAADARIDGRAELLSRLEANIDFSVDGSHNVLKAADPTERRDAQLILCAYHAWGEGCIKYLRGDFAFAIWDSLRRRLFCARDHFGVKPFYYSATQREFLFSSSPHALRLHPAVTQRLNENAIGDFLLFDMNLDSATSAFADIHRLPPGHSITVSADGPKVQSYWTLPVVEQLKYKDRQEYVDQFRTLMKTAVADRMRGASASIFLSGGLDSSVIATFACDNVADDAREQIKAFTYVYDHLMLHRERHYSSLVARALGIQISHKSEDEARLYAWPKYSEFNPSEIINEPLRAFFCDFVRSSSEHARVALTGDGGDALFYPEDDYLKKVAARFGWRGLIDDLAFSVANFGRVPRVGFRTSLRRVAGIAKSNHDFAYPEWLNPKFETRNSLRERWKEQNSKKQAELLRRRSYESLRSNMWTQLFANYDPDTTCSAVEVRYPFFDTRVVDFLLRLPSLPWCFEKGLLRVTTKEQLPAEIRKRPKTRIVEDPILARVKQPNWRLDDHFRPNEGLSDYVRLDRISKESWLQNPHQIWMNTRPLGLNYWLRSYGQFALKD